MKTTAASSTLLAFLFVVGASGCGADRPAEIPVGASHPIQGGTNDTTHLFAVGILVSVGGGQALCSGALLAPNLVATARHCVAAIPSDGIVECPTTRFGAVTSARDLVVTTDPDFATATKGVAVSKVITPSGSDQASVCGHDIALLILSQNITLPLYVTPAIKPPITDHSTYSTSVTAIGYGVTSASDPTGASAGVRRIKQQIKIACISNDKAFTDCLPSMGADVTASEFVTGDGTCEGDSGSSAYDQASFDTGRWVSMGVLSRGGSVGSRCVGGVYSRFDAWTSLVIDAATQAATMGGYAVPAWATADDAGAADGPVKDGSGSDQAAGADAGNDAPKDGPRDDASAGTGGSGAPGGAGGGAPTGSGGGGGRGGASSTGGGSGGMTAGSGGTTAGSGGTTAGSGGTTGASGGMNGAVSGSGGGSTTAQDGGSSSDAADASPAGPDARSGTGGVDGIPGVNTAVTGGCSCATPGPGPASSHARWSNLLGFGLALAVAVRRRQRARRLARRR